MTGFTSPPRAAGLSHIVVHLSYPSPAKAWGGCIGDYNALVPHAKLMKSTEALWTKVLPKFM